MKFSAKGVTYDNIKSHKKHHLLSKRYKIHCWKNHKLTPPPPPLSLLRVKEEANKNWLFISNLQTKLPLT